MTTSTIFDLFAAIHYAALEATFLDEMRPKYILPTKPAIGYITDYLLYNKRCKFVGRISNQTVIAWANSTGANISYRSHLPLYVPKFDQVQMPPPYQRIMASGHNYISALLHEMAHWTGHKSRLDRKLYRLFEIEDSLGTNAISKESIPYCEEEIIAELAAAQLALDFGVEWDSFQSGIYIRDYLEIAKYGLDKLYELDIEAKEAVNYLKQWQL
jgi:antirestriction protein ArdC